jgi:membrane protein DedA with SNARE-associated domain
MHWLGEHIQHFIIVWGYWAVIVALLGENAGIPLPGETVLIFASFLAYRHEHLQLQWVIVVGIVAATLGDNLGFYIGRRGGRPLLERWKRFFRIDDEDILAGEAFLDRRGSIAIFLARFIAGMRIVAGPLAGVLRMEWKRFLLANAAGAVVWVTTIALVGYAFGSQFDRVTAFFDKAGLALLALALAAAWWLWRRRRRQRHGRRLAALESSSTMNR